MQYVPRVLPFIIFFMDYCCTLTWVTQCICNDILYSFLYVCAIISFSMCIKVPAIVEEIKKALSQDMCIVIGLQTTGEVCLWFSVCNIGVCYGKKILLL